MSSHTIGPRPIGQRIQLAGRAWNDVAPGLQSLLDELTAATDAANIIIQQYLIEVNAAGEITVETREGGDMGRVFMLMGA